MRTRGLVDRQGADDDRRGATVALTKAGQSALTAAARGHVELVRDVVFDGVSAAQLRALETWTSQILARLAGGPA
jgi:DNA-binding MarR family transcriptional regulator